MQICDRYCKHDAALHRYAGNADGPVLFQDRLRQAKYLVSSSTSDGIPTHAVRPPPVDVQLLFVLLCRFLYFLGDVLSLTFEDF